MEKKVNIMVVDDEEIVRASLTSWLEEDVYHVEAVEGGKKMLVKVSDFEHIRDAEPAIRTEQLVTVMLEGKFAIIDAFHVRLNLPQKLR